MVSFSLLLFSTKRDFHELQQRKRQTSFLLHGVSHHAAREAALHRLRHMRHIPHSQIVFSPSLLPRLTSLVLTLMLTKCFVKLDLTGSWGWQNQTNLRGRSDTEPLWSSVQRGGSYRAFEVSASLSVVRCWRGTLECYEEFFWHRVTWERQNYTHLLFMVPSS